MVQPFAFTTPQNNTSVVAPNKQVRLAGVGATGTTVTVWNYRSKDRVIGTATVGKDGTWVIPNADLNNQDTTYELQVEYTAPGAQTQSLTHTITVKAAAGVERPFEVATPAEG
ncbi:Ig-like domain-containing protein, partial [Curtobacterium pusillum]|uniref:Ig-like domain-containing protein n=1 Tax=Curtobacterium pusillum TaxID=69373 RepID=UPI0011A69E18